MDHCGAGLGPRARGRETHHDSDETPRAATFELLAKLRKITEAGVEFRSDVDGSTHFLSPELSIEVQQALGADIIHPLDECLAYPASRQETERSLALTLGWARRSQAARAGGAQALFGIVQGGTWQDLRRRAVEETVALGFDGYAIGGMAVGEPKGAMYDLTELVAGLLPARQPRYLMGVGKPEDLVEAGAPGVDPVHRGPPPPHPTNRRGL